MIITSNSELYAKVRETISSLRDAGLEVEARDLQAAMGISSLPGEILGELRFVLRKIDRSRLEKREMYDIDSEITYIDSVLS